MFGVESYEEIAHLKDLASIFEGPRYAKWNSFARRGFRYLGLTVPRFLLRMPYGSGSIPVKSFNTKRRARVRPTITFGNAASPSQRG